MTASPSELSAPAPFVRAVESVRAASTREEMELVEITAPTGLAPYAIALAADVRPTTHGIDSLLGTGRFVLLYDPEEPDAWGGPFRVVAYAQAPLENEIGVDPFIAQVAWSWLVDALDARGAEYSSPSGTATKVLSTGFGELAGQGDASQLELRASWSPAGADIGPQVEAWCELLCMLAGLPPSSDAVALLPRRQVARD
ncbi:DUF3000 domain-containing protein [Homoserinibacter sp. GY 40078]|uniref:DUF3000 domain-containing protein n=1 Tax=Homoserinibacter sp. GY 40078 TaxID=2603275 RepID=UPI0011CAE0B2|nr:DUF3000 domain-containing protein [Homoserinibacter sp. GY 40078]TXK17503.1 DUF3000 domain-containing protein [Homoserinibacter sp. GY 40078]